MPLAFVIEGPDKSIGKDKVLNNLQPLFLYRNSQGNTIRKDKVLNNVQKPSVWMNTPLGLGPDKFLREVHYYRLLAIGGPYGGRITTLLIERWGYMTSEEQGSIITLLQLS